MAGIGSFIQGAFEGYEYGEGLKDRKTQRARNEERFEWERNAEGRTAENHEWNKEQRNRTREGWQRADAERDALGDIYTQTRDEWENGQGRGVIDGETAQDGAAPAPQPRSVVEATAPAQVTPPQGAQPPQQPSTGEPVNVDVPSQPVGRTQTQTPSQLSTPTMPQSAGGIPQEFYENPNAQNRARQSGVSIEQLWESLTPDQKGYFSGPQGQRAFFESGAQGPAQPQERGVTQTSLPQGQQQPPSPYAGTYPRGNAQDTAPQGRSAPPQMQAPSAPAAPQAAQAPAVVTPATAGGTDVRNATTEQLDAQAQNAPPDQGGAPSVAAASAAMTDTAKSARGVVGPGTGRTDPADEARAAGSFMEYYAREAAPKVVDYYLSQGDVAKATAFQEWSDSQQVKSQMESWSKAIWAISNGDEDKFVEHMSATYNAIDDGYSIDRERTKFVHDRNGNIVGAELAVVNDETGEVNIQHYDDQQDIVEMAVYSMSPEKTFEYLWGMTEKANQMRADAAKGARVSNKEFADMVADEADSIRKAQAETLGGGEKLTSEQIEAIAADNVRRRLGMQSTGSSTGQGGPQVEPPRL